MWSGVQRLNDARDDERVYQLDMDDSGHVADLEMFQQVRVRFDQGLLWAYQSRELVDGSWVMGQMGHENRMGH